MDIESYSVQLSSQHDLHSRQSSRVAVRVTVNPPPPQPVSPGPSNQNLDAVSSQLENEQILASRFYALKVLIEKLTGRKIKIYQPQNIQYTTEPSPAVKGVVQQVRQGQPGLGIEIDLTTVKQETEQSSFIAKGFVKTSDGQVIAFEVQFDASRLSQSKQETELFFGSAGPKQRTACH